jgi:hypothetical protein
MLQDHLPKLASGFYICGHPSRDKSYLSYSTPYVSFSRPSSGQVIHLTPNEAVALAELLISEAAHAEHGGVK